MTAQSKNVQTIVEDGAWTWFNDERALWIEDKLYIGYVRKDGRVALTCFDVRKGVSAETLLSSWRERDDHNNPALFHRADGKLLVAYASHGSRSRWFYRISRVPNPVRAHDWDDEAAVDLTSGKRFKKGWTYCNLYVLSGKLAQIGRAINWNPTLSISEDLGRSWGDPVHLIESRDRPYFKCSSSKQGRIDLAYTEGHPKSTGNSIYHVFLQNDSVYDSTGKELTKFSDLPLNVKNGAIVYPYSRDYPGPAWIWDLNHRDDTDAVIVHTVSATTYGGDLRYYYANFDCHTGNWVSKEIARGGAALYRRENFYAGGIVLDPRDNNIVYCSTRVNPANEEETSYREIYRGERLNSGDFSWRQLTFNSTADNFRPYVPSNTKYQTCLLWLQGNYRRYRNFDCKIRLFLED